MSAYTTVSTVCAAALLGCLVDLDVLDDQVAGIKTLGICVCLGVLEETYQGQHFVLETVTLEVRHTKEEFSGLDGPSGAGDTELLACNINPSAFCPSTSKQHIPMSSY